MDRVLNKKRTVIISSAGGILLAGAVCLTVLFHFRNDVPVSAPAPSGSAYEERETMWATQLETDTTAATTEASTGEMTEIKTNPPAQPVTSPFNPPLTVPDPETTFDLQNLVRLSVPMVSQLPDFPTGCEAASATMLLRYYGYNVTVEELVSAIPREDLYEENGRVYGPSIFEKFVGDPRKTYTDDTPGYGAFSPVITRSLNKVLLQKRGIHYAKNVTGCSFSQLLGYIDNGDPVIVWATARMKTPELVNSWYIKHRNGAEEYFEYPRGTHVMVLLGYDGRYVYIADPYFGYVKFTYSAFKDKWNLLGNQAIILKKGFDIPDLPFFK